MPTINQIVRRVFAYQSLVRWPKIGSDPSGRPMYPPVSVLPIQLACRWEDCDREVVAPDGRKVIAKSYLLMADPLQAGDLIWFGTLAQWQALPTFPAIPTVNQGIREVIVTKTTPAATATDGSNVYEYWIT
jgi:hypothetical protein